MSDTGRYRVRALDRALAILRTLNQHNGLNASELSRQVALPRPTVLRLLDTLSDAGYVSRSQTDNRYRATRRLRELSCGYDEEAWLSSIVRPFLAELEAELVWPLAVICLHDQMLIVEALTDHNSQMLDRRESAGTEVSPLYSASGCLFMALLPEPERQAYIAHVREQGMEMLERLGITWEDVEVRIARAREQQYAELHLPTHSTIGVPVFLDGRIVSVLNMRMHGSLEARTLIMQRYVAPLQDAASDLAARMAAAGAGSVSRHIRDIIGC